MEQAIRAMVDEPIWQLWLADLHPRSLMAGTWCLAARPEHQEWIETRFGRLLAECAGCPVQIVACDCQKAACAA